MGGGRTGNWRVLCCCEQSRSDCASGRGSEFRFFLKFSCEPFGESASIDYKNATLTKPTFWTQILRHPLPQRKRPRHSVSSSSLSPRSVGACDHLRHALMTAPPERPPPPSPSSPSFPTPEVSRCQVHLRPAGFVVPSEARARLVWDQVAAHLALDHGPIVSPVVRRCVLEAVRSCCCHLPAPLTFLPMWPAGPFSFMEPARSCLPSAELTRSSASFLPYQALGGKPVVVPGREAVWGLQMAMAASRWQHLSAGNCLHVPAAAWLSRWHEWVHSLPSRLSHEEDRFCSPV